MNNAIKEIKNTLEGTNSRTMEAEDRITEVEERIVEINESERKKELKEMRTTSETSGTMLVANIRIIGVLEEDKKKNHEKILEEKIVENKLESQINSLETRIEKNKSLQN